MEKISKIKIGIILGVIAGIIDVIPMIFQKLTWDANLSAFSLWVIAGFMISTSTPISDLGKSRTCPKEDKILYLLPKNF